MFERYKSRRMNYIVEQCDANTGFEEINLKFQTQCVCVGHLRIQVSADGRKTEAAGPRDAISWVSTSVAHAGMQEMYRYSATVMLRNHHGMGARLLKKPPRGASAEVACCVASHTPVSAPCAAGISTSLGMPASEAMSAIRSTKRCT